MYNVFYEIFVTEIWKFAKTVGIHKENADDHKSFKLRGRTKRSNIKKLDLILELSSIWRREAKVGFKISYAINLDVFIRRQLHI